MRKQIHSDEAPKPIGPYSQAVVAGGLMFISGQIALDPRTNQMVEGDAATQAEQVMKNLMAILKEAKMGPDNVVKTTVFLADMADYKSVNDVYAKYLSRNPPARSAIQAGGLPRGAKVEIDVIAAF